LKINLLYIFKRIVQSEFAAELKGTVDFLVGQRVNEPTCSEHRFEIETQTAVAPFLV